MSANTARVCGPESLRNARYGLWLFAAYASMYGAFMLVTAFWPTELRREVGGLPLSVVWGMVLIVSAFVLALAYTWLCGQPLVLPPASEVGRSPSPTEPAKPKDQP